MGCEYSSEPKGTKLMRMDTEEMLALPHNFVRSATRIRQDDVIDHVISRPDSPLSTVGSFIDQQAPSLVPSNNGFFNDNNFPEENLPNDVSNVTWKRPHELCDNPRLFIDGVSRGDVKQGVLGDCWLLAACAAVATRQEILERVIDPLQPLNGGDYTGMILLKFWRFAETVDVCIDDRLPTSNGKLIFASCAHSEEFWLPLLEKGFAKVYGGYGALQGGHACAALSDLTGGIAERMPIRNCSFDNLDTIFQHGAFVTCAGKTKTENGLVDDHAYTLTEVKRLKLNSGKFVQLVRLRSPWADSVEWRGSWSDGSEKWQMIAEEDQMKLDLRKQADGEFWMEFSDFRGAFDELTVATLGPDFDNDGFSDSPRQAVMLKGAWTASSAGGSRNNLENFQNNPQFLLEVPHQENEAASSFLIGLMQQPTDEGLLPIAFFIYKTESNDTKMKAEYFLCSKEELSSGAFTDTPEVLARTNLSAGMYIIIPATFEAACQSKFILRVYALRPFTLKELD